MKCSADGCDRNAEYKGAGICKMHYFRLRRNGTFEKLYVTRMARVVTPNGYVRIYDSGHDLSDKRGYVFEHRHVMWSILGKDTGSCRMCGKPESWDTCHVDHIDENRQNNSKENLRILCRGCNVKRGFKPESFEHRGVNGLIEFDGVKNTAAAWARDPRVMVTGHTILRRKASGMSDFDALFSPKVTHK